MSNEKLKEKKKKAREKAVKEKVLRRRLAIREDQKKIDEDRFRDQQIDELANGKQKPYRKPQNVVEDASTKDAKIIAQLERNMKLLEALEQEQLEEEASRTTVNDQLEAEGHLTMKQKMDALHQKALEMTGNAQPLAEATEEYEKENSVVQHIEKEIDQENEKNN
jgi:hypothetical protein